MKVNRRYAAVAVVLLLAIVVSCRKPKPTPPPPPPPPAPVVNQDLVILLPNEDGTKGHIIVEKGTSQVDLTDSFTAVDIANAAPTPMSVFAFPEPEVNRRFSEMLAAMPLPELNFVLYFRENSPDLTAESAAQLPRVITAIAQRQSNDIEITGHTDTTGDPTANFNLGLRRAQSIATLLQQQGAKAADLNVSSHGEANPLVKTADNVNEPRNRRVEIIVR